MVRACNKAGLCVTASSDGFLVDISPPIAGIVWDGFSALDQDFQSYRSVYYRDILSSHFVEIYKFNTIDGLWGLIGTDSTTLRVEYRGLSGVLELNLVGVISDHG